MIERRIGQGGMGVVYAARDPDSKAPMAAAAVVVLQQRLLDLRSWMRRHARP